MHILKTPPDEATLRSLAAQAGVTVLGLVNSRSTAFKEAKADLTGLTDEMAARLITQNPRIMFRPILSNGKQAALGFGKEKMEAVLAGQ